MRLWWIVTMALVGTALAPTSAEAQLTLGGHVGYGVGLNSTPDPYRGLFGLRSGWNFDSVYLGGHVSFYTGDKTGGGSTFRQLQVLGVDAGYDFDLGKVVLRPLFGVGGTAGLKESNGRNFNEGAMFVNFGAEAHSKLFFDRVFFGGGLKFTSTFYDLNNINAFSFYMVAGTRFDIRGDGKGGIKPGEGRRLRRGAANVETQDAKGDGPADTKPKDDASPDAPTPKAEQTPAEKAQTAEVAE